MHSTQGPQPVLPGGWPCPDLLGRGTVSAASPVHTDASCSTCGAELHLEPRTGENAYAWADPAGATRCPATAMPEHLSDPVWWAAIRADTAAGVVDADGHLVGASYSVLVCALTLGYHPWNRAHVVAGGVCADPGRVVDCCGEPMRWAPTGWVCRVSGVSARECHRAPVQ